MRNFYFGPPPKGFKPDFESFLFNTKTHRLLQAKTGWIEFHLLDRIKKKIISSIFFHLEGGKASSPKRAPFGSFEISAHLRPKEFYEFVKWMEAELRAKDISKIEIVCPPVLFQSGQPLITSVLVSQGYQIVKGEPGCCLQVDGLPLLRKMRPNKQNVLRQGERAGLLFKILPLSKLQEVYHFLDSCRKEKDQSLSMTLPALTQTTQQLANSFLLVGIYLKDEMVGAAVVIRIHSSVAYTFYLGHSKQHNKLSPVVFLVSHLYDWCQQSGISILDLGTSALDGQPNFPLLDFKLRMGGILTPKFTFTKTLAV